MNLEVQRRRNIWLTDFRKMKEGKKSLRPLIFTYHFFIKKKRLTSCPTCYLYFIVFRWGFLPVYGDDEYLSICEMPIEEVNNLLEKRPIWRLFTII